MLSLTRMCYFGKKKTSSVNKDQNMLHKLSLDTHGMAIYYRQEQEYVHTNIFSFGDRILPEYRTCDVVLSKSRSTARPMELRCVFNKVFLVNHLRAILNCSYKWLCFINSDRCIGRKL